MLNLLINLGAITILISQVRSKRSRLSQVCASALIFNLVTFILCTVLRQSSMEVGIALGLFAMFGVIRYRSEPVETRNLSFLFVAVGLGLLNGMASSVIGHFEAILYNCVLLAGFLVGMKYLQPNIKTIVLQYDRLELLKPQNHQAFKNDLKQRLDIDCEIFDIIEADLLRDTATVKLYVQSEHA